MGILDIIFPKRCLGCGRLGKYFCDQCKLTVKIIAINEAICPVCEKPSIDGATHPGCQTRYALDGITSFFRYDGMVRKAVKAIKYRLVSDLASEFISLVPSSLFYQLPNNQVTVLVPIPLHPSRLRFRGFNQAEILGKLVAQHLNISVGTDILKRIKKTTPQVEMKDRDKRLKNMEKVFAVNPLSVKPATIFLFDDVFTTGATLRSAANTLKRAGVKSVWGITMAR